MKISGEAIDLAAGRVVLADPRLVVPEPVEVLDQLEILSSSSVGFSPAGWNGAMKMPKRIRAIWPPRARPVLRLRTDRSDRIREEAAG